MIEESSIDIALSFRCFRQKEGIHLVVSSRAFSMKSH